MCPGYFLSSPQFFPGQQVISLVSHPPEIQPGTELTIVRPWQGALCAVLLPNGEIHRWFASFELAPFPQAPDNFAAPLGPGSYATVVSNIGHGNPPHIPVGTVVRIVKCFLPIIFYDLMINGTEYHRWMAEFELAPPIQGF